MSEKKEYWGLRPGAWTTFAGVIVTILTLIAGVWRAQDMRINNLVTDMRVLESEVEAAKAKAAKQEKAADLMMSQLTEIHAEIRELRTTMEYISRVYRGEDSANITPSGLKMIPFDPNLAQRAPS